MFNIEPTIARRAASLKQLLIRENTDEVQVYDNARDGRQKNGRKLRGVAGCSASAWWRFLDCHCHVIHCAGEACNGLDHALQQNCFREIFCRKGALEEIHALRSCSIVEELRSYHRSLGVVDDLESGEFYFLYTGSEEEIEVKFEKMIQFPTDLSREFLDEVNQQTEVWFLKNLDHFRVRKAN